MPEGSAPPTAAIADGSRAPNAAAGLPRGFALGADRRPQAALLGLCVAAVALLWIGLAVFLRNEQQAVLSRVRADVANLAIAFEEQVRRTFLGVDQMMRFTKAAFEEDPDRFDLSAWIARVPRLAGDLVADIAIADANGVIAARLAQHPGSVGSIAEREYFRAHADNPDAGLVLSRPVRDRTSGRWSIPVTRRLDAPDGSFAGVLVASVDPLAIARTFEGIYLGANAAVSLIGPDGSIRARSPAVEGMFERNPAEDGVSRARIETIMRTGRGVDRFRSGIDGVDRMVGYRSLSDLPLTVVVGESVDEALVPVRTRRTWIAAGGGLITLVLLSAFTLLLRQLEAQRVKEIELARANEALAEGEARYRLLADNATDAIARVGLDGTVLYVSPAIRELMGYEPEEMIGTDPLHIVHPDDREEMQRRLRELVEAGPHAPRAALVYRCRRKDGRWVWFEVNATVVFDAETGEPTEFVDVIRDVSHRKTVEDELRRKSELLETTLENMEQGLVMIDADERVVVCNQRAIDLMGFPADLMATCPNFREVRRRQAENGEYVSSDPQFQKWIHEGTLIPEQSSYERVRPNGAIVEVRTVPLAGGGVVRTYTDITARRRAEQAGRESERRYRLLAEHASDIITLKVLGGERRYVSPACLTMLGYTPEEFLQIPSEHLLHPDDYPKVMAIYRDLGSGRREIRHVHRLRHKSGRWVWVDAAFKLMEHGETPLVLAAMRDVTERQRQAEELKAAKEEAETLLKKAQEASQAKSDFLASMSHEIRTPLNSIIGFTNLMLETEGLRPDQRRYVEQVRGSGSALLTIVNDVLDFSKIEAGQVELDLHPIALRALVDNAVSIVRGIAGERGIPIDVTLDADLPKTVVGDGDRLRQILLNLLNNAVKFTPQGRVSLDVRCQGERLRFIVTDTGIGISRDKLLRLFERFHQVDSSIRRKFGGTGLGLAISKKLVELMDGTIGVESREGEGSTFWFEVSLPESVLSSATAGPIAHAGSGPPARILLVEDVDINQELARLILERAGHRVDVAFDGGEALRALQAAEYDLVLMDVQMPVMDGITATQRIRAMDGPLASIPIIAMTANVLPDQIAKFKRAGMNDHVGKPFQVGELLAAVGRWTNRSAS
jgi:PAS domain S-box-containing protein